MFDQVLGRKGTSGTGVGVGTIVSIVVHVAILGVAIWVSTRPPSVDEKETEVTFFAAPPPPPPPPPPPASSTPKTEHKEVKKKPTKKPDTVVTAKDPTPQPETPPEPEQPPEEEPPPGGQEGGVVGGVEGGVVGGVIGGVQGGQLGGQLGGEVMNFGEGMTRPTRRSGRDPEYTREALDARVQGVMIVKCTITVEGDVTDCSIVKPLPYMEQAVMAAVRSWKMTPVTYQGRPVSVRMSFPIRLNLPE